MPVEYLAPEIANEGQSALAPVEGAWVPTDGEWTPDEEFQPFMKRPNIPDYKFVETSGQDGKPHPLLKYFPQFSGIPYKHQAFPCWAYHAKLAPRLLRTPQHATQHGMTFNKRAFKFDCTGEWHDAPVKAFKFDPKNPGAGKNVMTGKESPADAQGQMVASVVAAVIAQMGGAKSATPQAGDADYAEFLAFKAWKDGNKPPAAPTVQLSPADEKAMLVKIAEENGVKVDKRWSIDNLKAELDKIAK